MMWMDIEGIVLSEMRRWAFLRHWFWIVCQGILHLHFSGVRYWALCCSFSGLVFLTLSDPCSHALISAHLKKSHLFQSLWMDSRMERSSPSSPARDTGSLSNLIFGGFYSTPLFPSWRGSFRIVSSLGPTELCHVLSVVYFLSLGQGSDWDAGTRAQTFLFSLPE